MLKSHLCSVLKLNALLTTSYRNILQMPQRGPWSCPSCIDSGAEGICDLPVVTGNSQLHFRNYHLVITCGNGSSVGKAQIFSSCKSTWRNLSTTLLGKNCTPVAKEAASSIPKGLDFPWGWDQSCLQWLLPQHYILFKVMTVFFSPVQSIACSDDPYLSIGGTAV